MSQITQIKEDAVPSTCCRDHKSRSPTTAPFAESTHGARWEFKAATQLFCKPWAGWSRAGHHEMPRWVWLSLSWLHRTIVWRKKVTFKSKKLSLLSTWILFGFFYIMLHCKSLYSFFFLTCLFSWKWWEIFRNIFILSLPSIYSCSPQTIKALNTSPAICPAAQEIYNK